MKTHITVVLDASGSMETCRDEAISGHNEYVKAQRDSKANYMLVTFNTMGVKNFGVKDIKDAPTLTRETFVPAAMTPLFDAIGQTVTKTEAAVKGKKRKVLFVILTDGEENASKEYKTQADIKKVIDAKSAEGWDFVYLAQGLDAFNTGKAIGVKAQNAVHMDTQNMPAVMSALGQATMSYTRSSGATGTNFWQGVDTSGLATAKKKPIGKP